MLRKQYSLLVVVIPVVVALAPFRGMAEENSDWKNQLLNEVPQHWKDYLQFASSLQVTVTASIFDDNQQSPKRKQVIRQEYKQSSGVALHVYQVLEPKMEAEVEGVNPSYSFKLKRSNPDRGWRITGLDFHVQPSASSAALKKLQEENLRFGVCNCLTLLNLWLPTLIQDPDFNISEIRPQESDGRQVIRIDFAYPKADKDYPVKGALKIKGGWMVLDPEHDWILREYLLHTGQPQKYYIHRVFQIREGSYHHPIITKTTSRTVDKGESPWQSVSEAQFETVEQSDVPFEEFTLTAFGLPEPPGIEWKKPFPWYLVVGGVGIACLGIFFFLRGRAKRLKV
jgi:hypothetical protein